uniref:Hyaluronan and proteoglycan link protein 1a n=1 Tax=Myripristis murdjan TaxID=586833 RepID=A0A667Z2Q5_9TELE
MCERVYVFMHAHLQDTENTLRVYASISSNVTLPCLVQHSSGMMSFGSNGMRVKWTKLGADESLDEDVLTSMGFHKKSYGRFEDRVFLQDTHDEDASLVITDVSMDDMGRYRCEVINGMEDTIQEWISIQTCRLNITIFSPPPGVVFPYSPPVGRYNLNFHEAEQACLDQDAVVASFDQLYEAWRGGLDWCNAGWLSDGTVQYPITKPREPCGGANAVAGLRNYGLRDKDTSLFDVFCFASALKGEGFPERLTYDEAVQACLDDDAEIAKVGHMFAAWKLQGYDRCDAGWLADGSVRYPISTPRKNCSPTEAAVRFIGFPDKSQKLYGVYCFKAQQ